MQLSNLSRKFTGVWIGRQELTVICAPCNSCQAEKPTRNPLNNCPSERKLIQKIKNLKPCKLILNNIAGANEALQENHWRSIFYEIGFFKMRSSYKAGCSL